MPMSILCNPHTPRMRWALGAKEIIFTTRSLSLFFRLGKVLPIVRGEGIHQPSMNQVLKELNKGDWLHIYPEGKINETKEFMRLKWGVARLVMDADETPIVLPCCHYGIDTVMPNKEPYRLKTNQRVTIVFGEPMVFDHVVKELREQKKTDVKKIKLF